MSSALDSAAPTTPVRRRGANRRLTTVAVALIVVVLGGITFALIAFRTSPPPTLVRGLSTHRPDPSKGISGGSFTMDGTFSLEMGTFLCGKRDVRITSLSLYQPTSGIHLDRWGLENASGVNDKGTPAPGSLTGLGPFTEQTIRQHCGDAFYTRVGVQVSRTKSGTQSWLGLRLTYTSGNQEKVGYLWEQYHIH